MDFGPGPSGHLCRVSAQRGRESEAERTRNDRLESQYRRAKHLAQNTLEACQVLAIRIILFIRILNCCITVSSYSQKGRIASRHETRDWFARTCTIVHWVPRNHRSIKYLCQLLLHGRAPARMSKKHFNSWVEPWVRPQARHC